MDQLKVEDAVFKKAMEFFKDYAVSFFGIDVKVIVPAETEIKNIDIKTNITDYLFYTEDGNYLHFEFQTTDKRDDIIRFLYYDASLVYNKNKKVKTVVIYSADIKDVVTFVDMGTIKYEVQAFYMRNLNGDEKLMQLEDKILNGERLLPQDMLNLSFIPLMKSSENKSLRTLRSIELADKIENIEDKTQCLTLLYALLEKFGDEEAKKKFKEVFSMTEIGKMIREDGIKEGMKEGIKEGKKEGIKEGKKEGIKEGKKEGIKEGKTDILIKLLIKKFDKLSDEYKIKLRALSEETIDIITVNIFEMKDIKEIEKYF